jgi:hypothetical protein
MIAVLYGRRTAVFCGSKTDGCSVWKESLQLSWSLDVPLFFEGWIRTNERALNVHLLSAHCMYMYNVHTQNFCLLWCVLLCTLWKGYWWLFRYGIGGCQPYWMKGYHRLLLVKSRYFLFLLRCEIELMSVHLMYILCAFKTIKKRPSLHSHLALTPKNIAWTCFFLAKPHKSNLENQRGGKAF